MLKGLATPLAEKVRLHNLVSIRVAQVHDLPTVHRLPWIFECPQIKTGEVSVGHLDEYAALMKIPGVQHQVGCNARLAPYLRNQRRGYTT